MMDPEIKTQLLDALRTLKINGQPFRKNDRYLSRGEGQFCALGVLCELHRQENKNDDWRVAGPVTRDYMGATSDLPDEVAIWAGLTEQHRRAIYKLNDNPPPKIQEMFNVNVPHENSTSESFCPVICYIEKNL